MPTLKYLGDSFDCSTAIKGADYIHLLDENGIMVAAFDNISNFSGFTLENGSYTSPTAEHNCKVAVIRDDGTIGVGSHTCADIGNAVPKTRTVNGKPLSEDVTITADELGALTKAEIYTKNETLTGETKALYGLGANAVPNNVFDWLGNYNQHWWSVLHGSAEVIREYVEVRSAISDNVRIAVDKQTISYSKSIVINQTDGAVSLSNPTGLTLDPGGEESEAKVACRAIINLAPVYIKGLQDDPDGIYFIPDGATFGAHNNKTSSLYTVCYGETEGDYYMTVCEVGSPRASLVSSELAITNVAAGEKTYVHSADSNAYQDGATVDSKTYEYLGVPFTNAVSAIGMEMATYTGTGAYGAEAPNELKLNKVPKLMFIFNIPATDTGYSRGRCFAVLLPRFRVGMAMQGGNYADWHALSVEVEDKTVKWYAVGTDADQADQMNYKNSNYIVAALG